MGELMEKIRKVFKSATDGLRTASIGRFPSPKRLRKMYSVDEKIGRKIVFWRQAIKDVLDRRDQRFLAIVGPCSVHDEAKTLEYVRRLKALSDELEDKLLIVVRLCFEKPRTRNGWEGAGNDWDGDGRSDIGESLRRSRKLLWRVAKLGLPVASEALDQNSEQYLSDLLSFVWIGARTVESTTHRRMISALSMPVGVKNETSGGFSSAIDAMVYASSGRAFPGPNLDGELSIVRASGNPDTVLILRGGKRPDYWERDVQKIFEVLEPANISEMVKDNLKNSLGGKIRPNFSPEEIGEALKILKKEGLQARILIDASHANVNGDWKKQFEVWKSIVDQRAEGNKAIVGGLLESYLKGGKQPFVSAFSGTDPEVSVTDGCLSWEDTETLLRLTAKKLS
jgi:3-deoxy-7-phosphoheptulonate synthase